MSFDPLSEKYAFEGTTRDGWRFVASLTKRGRYVVAVQLYSPEGKLHGSPQTWLAGTFATLPDARDGALRYAHQLTPVDWVPGVATVKRRAFGSRSHFEVRGEASHF